MGELSRCRQPGVSDVIGEPDKSSQRTFGGRKRDLVCVPVRPRGGPPSTLTISTGALFVYRGTPSADLATELGLTSVPFEPRTYGIALEGRTSIGVDPRSVVEGLPLPPEDAAALLRTLTEAVAEYRANTDGASSPQTVAERLHELPDLPRRVVETAVRGGSVGRTEDPSTRSGTSPATSRWRRRTGGCSSTHAEPRRRCRVGGHRGDATRRRVSRVAGRRGRSRNPRASRTR
jgi:hypothetical protein